MSHTLISRSSDLARLQAEGYEIEVRSKFLLLKNVSYVTQNGEIRYGTLISPLELAVETTSQPSDHTVWFEGYIPCDQTGASLAQHLEPGGAATAGERRALGPGVNANYQFSRKPPSVVAIGESDYGVMLDAPLPESGPWPLVGIRDEELAQVGWNLERGALVPLGQPNLASVDIAIAPIGQIGGRGPYHADIYWDQPDGTPRGPFELIKPAVSPAPTYPMLWAHAAKRERRLVVDLDSEGRIKAASGKVTQDDLMEKAASVWGTATRAHYNRDLRFNSQSLIVAMTNRPCIGGRAWPSVVFENREHEYAFALWSNSTLGLLLHWWVANKTQSGRGTNTVTSIQQVPTLDVRVLTDEQMASAKTAFEALQERRFLPFDQIDEDPARAELDRRLLEDVLGLPQTLCEADGPIDLLRRKLAREPQIHGGKQTRVVFHAEGDENNEPRSDR